MSGDNKKAVTTTKTVAPSTVAGKATLVSASGGGGNSEDVTMMMTGHELVAYTLRQQHYSAVFGVVGIPVVGTGNAIRLAGIDFYSFRNEQACSYAVNAYSYITGRVGIMLSVAGPGVVHSLAGLANAQSNGWPMLLLSGAPDRRERYRGSFQDADLLSIVKPYVKWSGAVDSLSQFPLALNAALRAASGGGTARPGPAFLQISADLLESTIAKSELIPSMFYAPLEPAYRSSFLITPPAQSAVAALSVPPAAAFTAVLQPFDAATKLLRSARRPLLIIGKGAAVAGAEHELTRFQSAAVTGGVPFLPTPMGKGVLPDLHPMCVSAARSHALQHADVIVIAGARLNWMLHYGGEPRFARDVKIIQLDVTSQDMHTNRVIDVPLIGDMRTVLNTWNAYLMATAKKIVTDATGTTTQAVTKEWVTKLQSLCATNQKATEKLIHTKPATPDHPMSYYNALGAIRDFLGANHPTQFETKTTTATASGDFDHNRQSNYTLIVEGANTMDIARTVLPSNGGARTRLDAGTFATMGVGVGYAIAAHVATNTNRGGSQQTLRRVVAVMGDSAFGFSGMELETAARYALPIIICVINNNGIYSGVDQLPESRSATAIPVTALTPRSRYEILSTAFGGAGHYCTTPDQVQKALGAAFANTTGPTVINIMIAAASAPKPQTHSALNLARLVGGNSGGGGSATAAAAAAAPSKLKSKL